MHFVVGRGFVVVPGKENKRRRCENSRSIARSYSALHLLSRENESLLLRRDALLLLHTLLDPVHFVRGLDINLNLLSGQGLQAILAIIGAIKRLAWVTGRPTLTLISILVVDL